MIGRTITGMERGECGDQLLRLDDGTAIEISIQNYGDDLVVTHLTDAVIAQRVVDAEKERKARERARKKAALAAKRKKAHMDLVRGEMSEGAFEKWRREVYPTLSETLKDVWTDKSVQEQFAGPSPLAKLFNESR